mmetsp:Transcript_16410/g.26977  ORF Transcript_16410/g.26977 Transcript_16410/m.26977 type:complete len:149 (+) Transcript_16410:1397-1843(+)
MGKHFIGSSEPVAGSRPCKFYNKKAVSKEKSDGVKNKKSNKKKVPVSSKKNGGKNKMDSNKRAVVAKKTSGKVRKKGGGSNNPNKVLSSPRKFKGRDDTEDENTTAPLRRNPRRGQHDSTNDSTTMVGVRRNPKREQKREWGMGPGEV